MKENAIIEIEVNDWAEEFYRAEPDIAGREDLVKMVTEGRMNIAEVARLGIMSVHFGAAPADILPPNKLSLMTGAGLSISQDVARRKVSAQLPNGQMTKVREFLGPVTNGFEEEVGEEGDDHLNSDTLAGGVSPSSLPDPAGFTPSLSPAGAKRSRDYLLQRVARGYIENHLEIIAVNGGDVREVAEELKRRIDEMVLRLGSDQVIGYTQETNVTPTAA